MPRAEVVRHSVNNSRISGSRSASLDVSTGLTLGVGDAVNEVEDRALGGQFEHTIGKVSDRIV